MDKVLLVAGHGQGDPGAMDGGYNERDTMRQLADRVKALIPGLVDVYDKSLDMFQQTRVGGGMYTTSYKTIIELHMDAASPSASGGHVIIYKGYQPDELDKRLANAIKERVGWIRPNGFDGRDNLLNLNVAAQKGISYRLLELGFITNANDRKKIISEMNETAIAIAEAITGKEVNQVNKKDDRTPHYVVVGWFTQGASSLKTLETWLKNEKMGYTTNKQGNKIWLAVGYFPQSSDWKRKLEKYLDDKRWSYVVCYKQNIDDVIKKW